MSLTAEQLAIRTNGVTGSEIAAVAGLSPWAGPVDVWARKIGLAEGPAENSDMRRGTFLEPAIRQWYADEVGATVEEPGTLIHPQHPLVIATPDGIARFDDGSSRALEIKSPRGSRGWGEPGTDEIPDHYIPQVTWEMAVTGTTAADVAALIGGDLMVYRVAWDQELFDRLLEVAERFWANYVLTRCPPPPDGTEGCAEYLARRYPSHRAALLPANGEIEAVVAELKAAKDAEAEAAKKRILAENTLKAMLGDHEGTEGPWGRVTWRATRPVERIDWQGAAKAANIPAETIAEHTTTRPGPRVLRCHWAKE